jgi:hypothetical protein
MLQQTDVVDSPLEQEASIDLRLAVLVKSQMTPDAPGMTSHGLLWWGALL